MTKSKKDKLVKAGFKIGSAWDVVGLTPAQAKIEEEKFQNNKKVQKSFDNQSKIIYINNIKTITITTDDNGSLEQ